MNLSEQALDNNILYNTLKVTEGENVLIIVDEPNVGVLFSDEANKLGAYPIVILLPESSRPLPALSRALEAAINNSDVVLTVFRKVQGEIKFRAQIIKTVEKTRSARLAHMPNVDMDIITNCIRKTNYQELNEIGTPLIEVLARAKQVKIRTNKGTNLSFDLGGWQVRADGGFKRIGESGTWDNLPTGEVFKVPVEKSVNGTVVVDGAIPGKALGKGEEIILHIVDGEVVNIEDKGKSGFKNYLKKVDSKAPVEEKRGIYKISEFGIGINRNARKTSKPVEYEKRLGTVHLALGDNTPFHGNIKAPEHLDLMFESPTIHINGIKIIDKGQILDTALRKVCDCELRTYKAQRQVKITMKTRLAPTMVLGIAEIEEDLLYRHWLAPGKTLFKTLVGNEDTAKFAATIWSILMEGSVSLQDLCAKLQSEEKKCTNLARILYDFHLIEVLDDH